MDESEKYLENASSPENLCHSASLDHSSYSADHSRWDRELTEKHKVGTESRNLEDSERAFLKFSFCSFSLSFYPILIKF